MSLESTKIPSPASLLIKMMAGEGHDTKLAESLSTAVLGIGAALGAAGVQSGMSVSPGNLGDFKLDGKLPTAIAAAQGVDEGFRRF